MRRFILLGCVLLVILTSANAATWQVTVQDFQFTPAALTINQGDTVVWNNVLGTHDVHHACGATVFGNSVGPAPWTYQFVFNVPPGFYPYICEVHPDLMLGSITVLRPPHRWNVTVQNFSFTPQNVTVQPGDTIVWSNINGLHSVHNTSTPTRFARASGNAPWTYTFVDTMGAGTYPYICEVHPTQMQGNVVVTAPSAPPPVPNGLTIHVSSDNAILNWSSVIGANCYTVYRSENGADIVLSQLVGITGDTTFVSPISALPGSEYIFQVRAIGQ